MSLFVSRNRKLARWFVYFIIIVAISMIISLFENLIVFLVISLRSSVLKWKTRFSKYSVYYNRGTRSISILQSKLGVKFSVNQINHRMTCWPVAGSRETQATDYIYTYTFQWNDIRLYIVVVGSWFDFISFLYFCYDCYNNRIVENRNTFCYFYYLQIILFIFVVSI